MNIDDLRQRAKEAGIKSWHVKKPEKLMIELAKIDDIESPIESYKAKSFEVITSKECGKFLKSVGVKESWLKDLANKYNFDKLEYVHKFRAFRCYRNGVHVEWIDINDMSLLNGGRTLCPILLRHQRVTPARQIIKYHWR